MLVKYKIGSGSYTLLFDESGGDANEKFAPTFHDQVMPVPGYGAPSQSQVPMANTECDLPFKWNSVYASAAAALTAIVTFRSTFKGVQCHLQVTMGATVVYFPYAVLVTSSHDQTNLSVTYSVTFKTADITTTAP